PPPSPPQGGGTGVVGPSVDRIVLETEPAGGPGEVVCAARDRMVATAVLLRERDRVELGRVLEAELERARRLGASAARIAVRVETAVERLRPRPRHDTGRREHAELERGRAPPADEARPPARRDVHPD